MSEPQHTERSGIDHTIGQRAFNIRRRVPARLLSPAICELCNIRPSRSIVPVEGKMKAVCEICNPQRT